MSKKLWREQWNMLPRHALILLKLYRVTDHRLLYQHIKFQLSPIFQTRDITLLPYHPMNEKWVRDTTSTQEIVILSYWMANEKGEIRRPCRELKLRPERHMWIMSIEGLNVVGRGSGQWAMGSGQWAVGSVQVLTGTDGYWLLGSDIWAVINERMVCWSVEVDALLDISNHINCSFMSPPFLP